MKSDLPLFYYQPNDVPYLEKSLELNKKIFKDLLVIKGTDCPEFNNVYRHMCYNGDAFERLCFIRFFKILDYVKQNNIDKLLYCDSDAIFLKALDFEKILENEKCVACRPKEQNKFEDVTGAHFSIWTKEGLEDFCNYIIGVYTNNIDILLPKWEWHVETKTGGGICDMTLMYHWYKGKKNLYEVEGGTFDRGIGMPQNNIADEFEMKQGIKRLRHIDNQIFGTNYNGELVQFFGLHFQGDKKDYMYNL
jgi:lipopolysaccharide biosynthesis glycosyltransferase